MPCLLSLTVFATAHEASERLRSCAEPGEPMSSRVASFSRRLAALVWMAVAAACGGGSAPPTDIDSGIPDGSRQDGGLSDASDVDAGDADASDVDAGDADSRDASDVDAAMCPAGYSEVGGSCTDIDECDCGNLRRRARELHAHGRLVQVRLSGLSEAMDDAGPDDGAGNRAVATPARSTALSRVRDSNARSLQRRSRAGTPLPTRRSRSPNRSWRWRA